MSWWNKATEFAEQLKASEFAEKARVAAAQAAEAAQKGLEQAAVQAQVAADAAQAEYKRTFVDMDRRLWRIREDLLVMDFPSEERMARLSARVNSEHGGRMLILNMSERRYDRAQFQGEVVDVGFRGLPAPPLELLMELCLSAHSWLDGDAQHVLIVHCFSGFSRSAVFLSCFMAFRGLVPHPVDALDEVCRSLGIDDRTAVLPSQKRYISYFHQCQQGASPGRVSRRLVRVTLNGMPQFEAEGPVIFRPYIEVWNHGALVYSSFTVRPPAPPEPGAPPAVVELPESFERGEPCMTFRMPEAGLALTGDVLVRVRHVYPDGSRDTALRLAFHTAFVPEGLQLAKHEVDGASDDARFPDDFFLDLALAPAEADVEEAPVVYAKAREISKRCQEDVERQRRQRERDEAAAAAKAAAAASGALPERDAEDELEETLRRGLGNGSAVRSSSGTRAAVPAQRPAAPAGGAPNAGGDDAAALRQALADATADLEPSEAAAGSGKQTEGIDELMKDSASEIDNLFSDFDAVMSSASTTTKPAAPPSQPPAQPAKRPAAEIRSVAQVAAPFDPAPRVSDASAEAPAAPAPPPPVQAPAAPAPQAPTPPAEEAAATEILSVASSAAPTPAPTAVVPVAPAPPLTPEPSLAAAAVEAPPPAARAEEVAAAVDDFFADLDFDPVTSAAPAAVPPPASLAAAGSTAAAASAPAAPAPAASKPAAPAVPTSEIDDLFGDFDLALSSPATAAKGPPAAAAPALPPAAKAPAAGAADDLFGDVDDFLKELDAAAAPKRSS